MFSLSWVINHTWIFSFAQEYCLACWVSEIWNAIINIYARVWETNDSKFDWFYFAWHGFDMLQHGKWEIIRKIPWFWRGLNKHNSRVVDGIFGKWKFLDIYKRGYGVRDFIWGVELTIALSVHLYGTNTTKTFNLVFFV